MTTSSAVSTDDCIEHRLGMGMFQRRIYVAAGFAFGADAMEVLLLSFLMDTLGNTWDLEPTQTALLTSSVFGGALIGTLVLGALGDWIGRKPTFLMASGIIAVFGLLSAVTSGFEQFLILRIMVGFGIGGLTIPFDIMAEFLPQSERGNKLLSLNYFWTVGTLLVVLAAYVSRDDWRLLVTLTALPCVLSTLVSIWYVPESPRWLVSQGKTEKALAILRKAAQVNGREDYMELFPEGLQLLAEEEEPVSVFRCCSVLYEYSTLLLFLSLVWAGFGMLYYATIILITVVFQGDDDTTNTDVNYTAIAVSVLSEFVGVTFVIHTVDRYGRVWSQVVTYMFGGICIGLLCLLESSASTWLLICLAFGARLGFMSASCVTWTSTAELLPTSIRTTGHAIVNAVARCTGGMSPFVVVIGQNDNDKYPIVGVVLFVTSIIAVVSSWMLPETKDKTLGGANITIHQDPIGVVPAERRDVELVKHTEIA